MLTAAHVVKDVSHVTVEVGEVSYRGTVERVGKTIDLAVVSVLGSNLHPIATNRSPTQGEAVFAVGFALSSQIAGLSPIISRGTLNKVVLYKGLPTLLLSSALVLNGHSGGALIDADHRLIGIISSNAKLNKAQIFPHCNMSVSYTASLRNELWEDSSKDLAELQSYETVRSLPKYKL